jgi:hypothetical protein
MERAVQGHKDITGSIARKREKDLMDDTLPDGKNRLCRNCLSARLNHLARMIMTPGKPGVFYCPLTIFQLPIYPVMTQRISAGAALAAKNAKNAKD